MKITPMSETEYDIWAPRSRANYALDKKRANSLTQSEAEKIAQADFNRLLPDGLNSKNNFLYSMKDGSGNILGFAWFTIRGADDNKRAFVCDIIIEEAHRGKGYGKQMMLFMEEEAKKNGLNRIGLHVFGFNNVAIRLYQSLGYMTTDLVMEKELPAIAT